MSLTDRLRIVEDERNEYRRIIEVELRNHQLFSRFTVLTGAALAALGTGIVYYSPSLVTIGYLLVIVGVLRILNMSYDVQREDKLKKMLRVAKEKFRERVPDSDDDPSTNEEIRESR